jgi:GT2 family glycosyltransferase
LKKEVIFVDNGSSDGTADMVRKNFPETLIIKNRENIGFARANNLAYPKSKGKYILMLNSDAFIKIDTLQKTIDFMEQNRECGVLGCRLIDKEGQLMPSARYFPTPWRSFLNASGIGQKFPNNPFLRGTDNMKWDHCSLREIDWVPGCFLLTRRKIINEIGFLDNAFFLYRDDCDFCLRVKKKGWKVVFYPGTEVMHIGGASAEKIGQITSSGRQNEKLELHSEFLYFRKNHGILYVVLDLFFICLLDIMRVVKRILSRKKTAEIRQISKHMRLAYDSMIVTKFGKRPIY